MQTEYTGHEKTCMRGERRTRMRGTKCEKNTYERYKRSFVTWQCLCRGHCSFFPRTLYSLQERKLSLLLMCFAFKFFSTANYLCIDFHLILRFQKAMICVSISTSALCTGNHGLYVLVIGRFQYGSNCQKCNPAINPTRIMPAVSNLMPHDLLCYISNIASTI